MNPYVQTILSLLDSARGLPTTVVTTEGTDGRLYVQVVGVLGFPVFTINPSGRYDLPFEHSYTRAGMTKMGLPILAGKSEGLNAVLFADKLAARPRNRHDPTVRPQHRPAMTLRGYFESEDGQKRALEACRNFLGVKDWAVGDRFKLYDASRHAFDPSPSTGDALGWFRQIYDELVRPAPAGGWGVARNASGPLWSAEKTFQTIKAGLSNFSWDGTVTLTNFHNSSIHATLVSSLEKMRSFKPVTNWPVMAVSKVLHFYNPELFPVYDNEVIGHKVLRHFRNEFREFCWAFSPPYDVDDTPIFYRNYMCWGAALLASAHPQFMKIFAEWLAKQPGAELSTRQFDPSRLFATAFEFMIIGAYAADQSVIRLGRE